MNTTQTSRPPAIWRGMRQLNRRAVDLISRGHGPGRMVLLLTTIGRKSGLPRVTPLQFEEFDSLIYVASARGPQADWFRNLQADPRIRVRIDDRQFDGLAEPIVEPARIADFLELRLKHHPLMMRLMLLLEGVPPWANRAALERVATKKALVIIRPLAPAVAGPDDFRQSIDSDFVGNIPSGE